MTNLEHVWHVYEVRSKASFAGPGVYGYDAEARVEDEYGGRVYVHVNDYCGRHYTVTKKSMYDFMTGPSDADVPEKEEEYESLKAAEASKYRKVFKMLSAVVSGMQADIK